MHKHRPRAQKKGALCGDAQTSAVQVQVRRKLCGSKLQDDEGASDFFTNPVHELSDDGAHENANSSANTAPDAQHGSKSVWQTRGADMCRLLRMRLVYCEQLRQWLRAWYEQWSDTSHHERHDAHLKLQQILEGAAFKLQLVQKL